MSRQADREPRVVFGFHAVLARLRADPSSVLEIYLDETRNDARARDLAALAERAKVHLMRVPTRRLDGFYGGGRHQGVVARIEIKKTSDSLDEILEGVEHPLLLVLDGVTDPHNLGACLRSADAFGVHAIVVPKDRAASVNATVAKVASGAADTIPVIAVTNLARTLRALKDRGIWLVGADAESSESLFTADLAGPIAWILGAEGSGMRRLTRDLCDRIVSIPLAGIVSSLNVSVAAGICLYATRQQRARQS